MRKKYLAYLVLPALLLTVLGASAASAHGWFGGFGNASPEEIAERQEAMFENKATLLGISVEEMKDVWAEGKSLWEIAEDLGLTQEELQERMQAARKEQLQNQMQALVEQGVISQEQANKRLQFMEERMANGKMGRGFGRHPGGCPCQGL